jgi:hypothetical protein
MPGRKCAYCGIPSTLTKEHLLPDCISKHWDKDVETNVSTGGSQRIVTSDPKIGDVCAHCNNVLLSKLDDYVCGLYEEHFAHMVRPGNRIVLNFDFDQLLRWLLKTCFNVARARRWSTPLEQARGYILGKDTNRPACRLFLQLITPTKVKRGEIKDFPEATEVPPILHRLAPVDVSSMPGLEAAFLLSLNSYYFYVLLENPDISKKIRLKSFNSIIRDAPGAQELKPEKRCTIYASSVDALEAEMQSEARIRNVLNWSS